MKAKDLFHSPVPPQAREVARQPELTKPPPDVGGFFLLDPRKMRFKDYLRYRDAREAEAQALQRRASAGGQGTQAGSAQPV